MGRKKRFKPKSYGPVTCDALSSKGFGIVRVDGKVVFTQGAVPGDVLHIKTYKRQKRFNYAFIEEMVTPSQHRTDPFCKHFGTCGGCKLQHISYAYQTEAKEQSVRDAFQRIGGLEDVAVHPIRTAEQTRYYRNKLEFTFSAKRYVSAEEIESGKPLDKEHALGFHAPGVFSKAVNIETCYLQDDFQNVLRNTIRELAIASGEAFYDNAAKTGFFRNVLVRKTEDGQWMVCVIFGEEDEAKQDAFLQEVVKAFPTLHSVYAITNTKRNDSYADLQPRLVSGQAFIQEKLGHVSFSIRPKSFFQTNTKQAEVLFDIVADYAGLTGAEVVYDLYCGVGSIGLYLAHKAKRIVGIEVVDQAVEDARINAQNNQIENAHFFEGDMRLLLQDDFIGKHGRPDVLITDPPRAGMHPDVIDVLNKARINRIVYVSCNPATQARDLALLNEVYNVVKSQPVDMFPHTPHVENVTLLTLR